jgi:prolyl-tRNA editing enzyme YbaK/EbsC (Cys-tRNA(Pro) deacylase)
MSLHANAQRVQAALFVAGSTAVVVELPDSAGTALQAAQALGVEVAQIAKSLVFLADDAPVMVVASGADRVDLKRLSAHLGGAKIGRADADGVRAATGYPIGGVSPAGLKAGIRILVDRALQPLDEVWAAGGTPHAVFRTTFDELLFITGGEVADVAAGPPAGVQ